MVTSIKKPVPQLSTRFNKTAGAIRSRLIHLQDPTHKAYQRRVKNGVIEMLEPDSAPAAIRPQGGGIRVRAHKKGIVVVVVRVLERIASWPHLINRGNNIVTIVLMGSIYHLSTIALSAYLCH